MPLETAIIGPQLKLAPTIDDDISSIRPPLLIKDEPATLSLHSRCQVAALARSGVCSASPAYRLKDETAR